MKKYNIILFLLFLISCTNTYTYQQEEQQLAQEKDIFKTLEAYKEGCVNGNIEFMLQLSTDVQKACCTIHNSKKCGMSEEKCNSIEHEHTQDRSICYFNYKKYLPEGTAKNVDDFQEIWQKYKDYQYNISFCNGSHRNDGAKASECINNERNKFLSFVKVVSDQPEPVTDIASAQRKEKELREKRDVMKTLSTFADLYMTDSTSRLSEVHDYCSKVYRNNKFITSISGINVRKSKHELASIEDKAEIIKIFAEPQAKTDCFVHNPNSTFSQDECVLARRSEYQSEICFFDYKRFLPESSRIKKDYQFKHAVNVYWKLYRVRYIYDEKRFSSYCEELREITSSEREKCEQNAKKYLIQIINDNVPPCKKRNYNDYIKNTKGIEEKYDFEYFCNLDYRP